MNMSVVTADIDTWNSLQAKAQEIRIAGAFREFENVGIQVVLIKGWAAARKYPRSHVRRPGDMDLAVSPEDFKRASEFIVDPEVARYNIDLHKGLRQLDSVDWTDLFKHSELVDLNGTSVRVLCDEDHLRVLCVHWLIDGGGYKDKLWDIYYAVQNRSADFDWDRCLNVVSAVRRKWVICAIALAHRYLGLKVDDLPFANELETIPNWITNCVEREWSRAYRLEPVLISTHDKRLLLHQIARRIPPNPIRATIEAEGDLYGNRRRLYQAQVLGRRALPFARDLVAFVKLKMRGTSD
jgi:hypothetical protein